MIRSNNSGKIDFLDAQKKFMDENGINHSDGAELKKIMILFFETGKDGKPASQISRRKISLDWNAACDVKDGELWICHVTMKTNTLGFARPLRRIEPVEIYRINGEMESIAKFMWNNDKKEVMKYIDAELDSEAVAKVEAELSKLRSEHGDLLDKFRELEEEKTEKSEAAMEEAIKESEDRLKEVHRNEIKKLEGQITKLENERKTITDYYEDERISLEEDMAELERKLLQHNNTSNNNDGNEELLDRLNETISRFQRSIDDRETAFIGMKKEIDHLRYQMHAMEAKKVLRPMSESVIRISSNEFKCSFMKDGRYSVMINADMTVMRFAPDGQGIAKCHNGIISIPELYLIDALDNKIGELNWKMIGEEMLEVSV